jgi:class 3 adenylate cyclase
MRANILIKLGMVEFKFRNQDKANDYLKEAYRIANDNNQQLLVVQSLIGIGIVNRQNNVDKAIQSYKEAEVLAKRMEANDELRDIYEGLYRTYELKGDYLKAFEYQKSYLAQKDLLFNIETDDKIRGLQFDFDLEKKEDQIGLLEKEAEITELQAKRQQQAFYVSLLVSGLILIMGIGVFKQYRYVKKSNKIISEEKNRSENLLLNILPEETAQELKANGKVQAKKFESVTVLFTDFKGFTHYAHNLSPEELVRSVDYYFSKFDEIMDKYGMEKIKTIGDAYMCAGGLPFPSEDHPIKMIEAAFEIAQFIDESKKLSNGNITHFDVRIGINTGPVVAGVVGIKKFAYDIWGDTVNVASRMESKSEPGRINISENTYKLVKDDFQCEYRGEIDVKNKGMMKMYFVNRQKNKEIKQIKKDKNPVI